MTKRLIHCTILLTIALCLSESIARAQTGNSKNQESNRTAGFTGGLRFELLAQARPARRVGFALMPSSRYGSASDTAVGIRSIAAGPTLPVVGGGTIGRLTKLTGFTSSNSFIGDSTIFESKLGLVGIGTDSPTSRLTVAGLIESTMGGFKFPDGTVQTTSANGALFEVVHDATLVGNGSQGSPLGVAVPLILVGSVDFPNGVIRVTNTGLGGVGVRASGGPGGVGVRAAGGDSLDQIGGNAVQAFGGSSNLNLGGRGVNAFGGDSANSSGGEGVIAQAGNGGGAGNSGGIGIEARAGVGLNGATDGLAGRFIGGVEIMGDLNVTGSKNFKIDHPLDPENKYLYHAAIESAEALNIYSGNVRLESNGEAVIRLPEWFQAINRDFRYSLTPIGASASDLFISEEITNNQFRIAGGVAGLKVSWQVTGVRSDRAVLQRPFKVEQDKPVRERGTYLNPEAYRQVEERGVDWARHTELMRLQLERCRQHPRPMQGPCH
jgi:hypothetical protein